MNNSSSIRGEGNSPSRAVVPMKDRVMAYRWPRFLSRWRTGMGMGPVLDWMNTEGRMRGITLSLVLTMRKTVRWREGGLFKDMMLKMVGGDSRRLLAVGGGRRIVD